MSGVIDKSGQQWEHCCHCGEFVKFEELMVGYSPKWPNHAYVDLCPKCYGDLNPIYDSAMQDPESEK